MPKGKGREGLSVEIIRFAIRFQKWRFTLILYTFASYMNQEITESKKARMLITNASLQLAAERLLK